MEKDFEGIPKKDEKAGEAGKTGKAERPESVTGVKVQFDDNAGGGGGDDWNTPKHYILNSIYDYVFIYKQLAPLSWEDFEVSVYYFIW